MRKNDLYWRHGIKLNRRFFGAQLTRPRYKIEFVQLTEELCRHTFSNQLLLWSLLIYFRFGDSSRKNLTAMEEFKRCILMSLYVALNGWKLFRSKTKQTVTKISNPSSAATQSGEMNISSFLTCTDRRGANLQQFQYRFYLLGQFFDGLVSFRVFTGIVITQDGLTAILAESTGVVMHGENRENKQRCC